MRFTSQFSIVAMLAVAGMFSVSVATPVDGAIAQDDDKKKKKKKKKDREEQPAREELSELFRTPYQAAFTAYEAADYPTAKGELDKAAAFAVSNDEKFRAGNLYVQLGARINDVAVQRIGLDLMLDSGKVVPENIGRLSFFSGNFAYNAGDFEKARQRLGEAIAVGYNQDNVQELLAETYFKENRTQEGLSVLKGFVDTAEASGTKAPEAWYQRGVRNAFQAKLVNETVDWTQGWVKAYPSDQSWRDSLVIYRQFSAFSSQQNIDLMRLMRATSSLKSEQDYAEYIENADPRRLPGEVVSVIEEGIASGNISANNGFFKEQLGIARPRVAEDRGSLASAARDAQNSANGRVARGTADAYLGYADYVKAESLYETALSKGGVDADTVNIRKGIAELSQNKYDEARTSFAAVVGSRKPLAKFWMIWLEQKSSNGAAASAASVTPDA